MGDIAYDGSNVKDGHCYYLESGTLKGLLKIAIKLNTGDRISADERRDMAQWMQARLTDLVVCEDEEITPESNIDWGPTERDEGADL